jgi:phosphate-selective porin
MKGNLKGIRILVSMLAVMLTAFFFSASVRADQTDDLIKILVDKGIITSDEAKSLEKEVKGQQALEKPAKTETPSGEDLTKKIEVGYNKGAYIKTPDDRFSLKINVRTQELFKYEDQEDEKNTDTFNVRRARLLFGGNAFYPWMKYFTQVTLEGGSAALRDAYIEAAYYDWAKPQIGQYKVPFDREFLTSAFSLELIDRSIVSNAFSLQRDIGVQVSGGFFKNQLNYALGMFNGSGANQTNQDQNFMYVGRVVYTPFGSFAY